MRQGIMTWPQSSSAAKQTVPTQKAVLTLEILYDQAGWTLRLPSDVMPANKDKIILTAVGNRCGGPRNNLVSHQRPRVVQRRDRFRSVLGTDCASPVRHSVDDGFLICPFSNI